MLFVGLYSPKPSTTPAQTLPRRMEFKPPEGIKLVGEYWLQNSAPRTVVAFEADDYASIMAMNRQWADLYDITVVPAITGEEGMKLVPQMMAKR